MFQSSLSASNLSSDQKDYLSVEQEYKLSALPREKSQMWFSFENVAHIMNSAAHKYLASVISAVAQLWGQLTCEKG